MFAGGEHENIRLWLSLIPGALKSNMEYELSLFRAIKNGSLLSYTICIFIRSFPLQVGLFKLT